MDKPILALSETPVAESLNLGPRVSMVAHATSIVTCDADAVELVGRICSGKWNKRIEEIRHIYQRVLMETHDTKEAKKAVAPLKKKLPGVQWSGRFSSRQKPADEKLIQPSGLLCADIDDLGERLQETSAKLKQSPHLFALFTSPTGNGLKAIFRVPADVKQHAASWLAVQGHVLELCGEEIDQSCRDLARLCFVSYDPDTLLNAEAVELRPVCLQNPASSAKNGSFADADSGCSVLLLKTRQGLAEAILGTIRWESESHGFCVCPGENLHSTQTGVRDCEIHVDGAPTIHCFHDHCRLIVESTNKVLRSQTAKAERGSAVPDVQRSNFAAEYRLRDESPVLAALPCYTPPPLDLLPTELQEYVLAASDTLGVDVSYIFLPLLSALGAAIGDSHIIRLKSDFDQPPIIWTAIIGRSGSKKSPALDEAMFAIREREREFISHNGTARELYERQLAEWEAAPRRGCNVKPTPPPLSTGLMDDLTLPSLAAAHSENPHGLLVVKDELSHWFESFDQFTRAQGADVSRWLSLHTGKLFAYDRKSNRERYRLFNPRVSIAGGIQPKTLRRCLTEDYFDRGLPARFLFAWPPAQQDCWSDKTIPKKIRESVLNIFSRVFALLPQSSNGRTEPKAVTLATEARAEFIEFYNSIAAEATDACEHEEAAWQKIIGYGARLALVGELARCTNERVTKDTMVAATDLARWFGNENRRIYTLLAEDSATDELRHFCEFIRRRDGVVTVREVITNYRPLKNQSGLAEIQLNKLVAGKQGEWLPIIPTGKGGRPTRSFRLFQDPVACLRLQNPDNSLENEDLGDANSNQLSQKAFDAAGSGTEIPVAVSSRADLL